MVKSYIKAIVIIIVLFFLVTFAVKNSGAVQISYYFGIFNANVPLYFLAYACLVLGVIIGWLISFGGRLTLKRKLKTIEKEHKEIRAELDMLRAKTAVPVYNENMYVPTPQPVVADDLEHDHEGKRISDAY